MGPLLLICNGPGAAQGGAGCRGFTVLCRQHRAGHGQGWGRSWQLQQHSLQAAVP